MMSSNCLRCAGTAILLALGSVVSVDAQVPPSGQASSPPCEVGSYHMADGTSLDIGPGGDLANFAGDAWMGARVH